MVTYWEKVARYLKIKKGGFLKQATVQCALQASIFLGATIILLNQVASVSTGTVQVFLHLCLPVMRYTDWYVHCNWLCSFFEGNIKMLAMQLL